VKSKKSLRNPANFNRAFQKAVGISPSLYSAHKLRD
jgi:AraC-like DNA-binding protein